MWVFASISLDCVVATLEALEAHTQARPALARGRLIDLEKDKWVKGLRWVVREDAYDLIRRAISRFHTT